MRQQKIAPIVIGLGVWLGVVALLTISTGSSAIPGSAYAQADTRAINAVRVESNRPGELSVSWDPPTETPSDYRVIWARVGEKFLSWSDS